MRLSRLFLPTERQPPADAEAISHKLMVRAGLIRQVGTGLWSWLPAGWRSTRRSSRSCARRSTRSAAQEMLMPVMDPAEIWKKSGRYGIPEQFQPPGSQGRASTCSR
jgi:prolyl-tRNA synthetase